MSLPAPEPGLVLAYNYLWRRERQAGEESGRKTRPCVVLLAINSPTPFRRPPAVFVVPITHAPPVDVDEAIQLSDPVKRHLGLDSEKSWIVISEANVFRWPGHDLRRTMDDEYAFGFIPPRLYELLKRRVGELRSAGRFSLTKRD